MSETQEPYGRHELSATEMDMEYLRRQELKPTEVDLQALHAEGGEKLTQARVQLMAIAAGMQGEIEPAFLMETALALTEIAQTMQMCAHFDLAVALDKAEREAEELRRILNGTAIAPGIHA